MRALCNPNAGQPRRRGGCFTVYLPSRISCAGSVSGARPVSAWLYRILVNQCRSIAARRAHRERVFVREEALLLNAPDKRPAWSGEDEELVQRVLNELDPLLREAFLLKYIEELSYEEMAALTGAGVSALKMRVKRACDKLRDRWERIRDD